MKHNIKICPLNFNHVCVELMNIEKDLYPVWTPCEQCFEVYQHKRAGGLRIGCQYKKDVSYLTQHDQFFFFKVTLTSEVNLVSLAGRC